MRLSSLQIEQFREAIIGWQASHGRHDLPWQNAPTAYHVHVSEIMLQQTQVTTVIPYFVRWMERFPNLDTLAKASEDEVMSIWQGLGYYSRARNLRRAAQHLVEHHAGDYPNDLTALNAIPGVGRYTAGAIRSFAFNDYGPIVDGNVKRLYARLFTVDGEPNSSAFTKTLWQLAEQLTPADNSRAFSQGVLDLGALQCKKSAPACDTCPLQTYCQAYQTDTIGQYPNAKARKPKPTKQAHFVWHAKANSVVLVKRPSPGIWGGLWCFPQVEAPPPASQELGSFTHQFSHYRLQATVWLVTTDTESGTLAEPTPEWQLPDSRVVDHQGLENTGLPTPIRQFIEDIHALDYDLTGIANKRS